MPRVGGLDHLMYLDHVSPLFYSSTIVFSKESMPGIGLSD